MGILGPEMCEIVGVVVLDCQPPEEPRRKRTNPQQRMFICQKGMCAGVDRGLVGDMDLIP